MSRDKPLVEALSLFSIRVKPIKVRARAIASGWREAGVNKYDPATKEATLPIGDNAYERTIRLHEALHAIYSPKIGVANTIVHQTTEDLRLHLNKAKLEGQPRRDEITSAVTDLRAIGQLTPKGWKMTEADDLLGVFLRSVAILQGHSGWTPSSKASRYSKLIKRAYSRLQCKNKAKLGQSLKRAFTHIKEEDAIDQAVKVLSGHFLEPDQPPNGGKGGEGSGVANPLIDLVKTDGEWQMMGWGNGEFADIKLPQDCTGALPKDTNKRLVRLHEKKLIPTVRVHRLALTHPKKSEEGPKTISAYSGSKIRAKRLAAALTSPVPIRLFKRRRINTRGGVGGTILIDSSGSMGIKDGQLDELMELCPMGSIAYYHSISDGSDKYTAKKGGDLIVVAERGKQADLANIKCGTKGRPERGGGNLIDLQAMQWMMTHPKPWWFLTDGDFTGACNKLAQELLHSLMAKGLIKQVHSIGEMKEILRAIESGNPLPDSEDDSDSDYED
jgi:hypothetical protein